MRALVLQGQEITPKNAPPIQKLGGAFSKYFIFAIAQRLTPFWLSLQFTRNELQTLHIHPIDSNSGRQIREKFLKF